MENNNIKLAIIGKPLAHSISPVIQTAAIQNANLSGSYEKFEIEADEIEKTIEFFKMNNYAGFNVTIPYKIEILKYLDEIENNAQKIGAVNTVKITKDKKLIGYNTDIFGFTNSIPENKKIKNAVLLGCGGAALAVVFGLDLLKCENIIICARNKNKATDFVNNIKNKTVMNFEIKLFSELKSLADTDILINATPLGTLGENENKMPINENIIKSANKDMFVFDLVYNPPETKLLTCAKQQGLKYTNGLPMLLLQGAKAFEIWTGIYPSIEVMQKSVNF